MKRQDKIVVIGGAVLSAAVSTALRKALAGQPAQTSTYTCGVCGVSMQMEQPAQQEPPAWWPAVENILKEYGLQAIDFVADFKAALAEQPAQQEPVAALQRVMTRLADLLDEDQFAEIEGIVTNAGVMPPARRKPWIGLTHKEHMEIMTGTMTTSSRMAAVEAKLREKNQ